MKKFLIGAAILTLLAGGAAYADDYDLTVEEKFQILEEDLRVMEAKEQEMFDEYEAKAQVSAQNLATLKEIRAQIVSRINRINAEAKKGLLTAEKKQLASDYAAELKKVDAQIVEEQKVVNDWTQLKAIRTAAVIK
ncbi:MAG: hypothetical protein LBQ96_05585 [Fusobacteriaceae bacterium]|jgi:hypothetical protein|nr:hypothetical protein [Fusobacteriaceae bacterium]